ncbi:MAG: ABC transporter permease [Lachnospiraceae bacterium]|jgi:peptide/nickel transport system permease protein|nr:ABC transporter permease [Lachnospiraceae bacterium]
MREFLKNKAVIIGSSIIMLMILIAIFAPFIAKYDYDILDFMNKNKPPSAEHIFGTDPYGRDVFSRIVYGARISLTVSIAAVALAIVIGSLLGIMSGFFKGKFDFFLGRIIDIMMSFPSILFSLIIGMALGASVRNMCISVGIPLIPIFYRVSRGATLNVGERTYVMASTSMGSGRFRTMLRHVLPNALPQIFVVVSLAMGGSIMAEASLGFLGMGIPQPTPSWGLIVNEGKEFMFSAPWTTGFSGLFIALTILGFNMLGDGLRDYLDPKLRGIEA